MHGGNFVARSGGVKAHGAILGMQMHCNRLSAVIPGRCGASNPESRQSIDIPGSPLPRRPGMRVEPAR